MHTHRLGADWHDDPVLWAEHPTPETWPDVKVSPDGRYVLVQSMVGWSRYDQHLLDRTTGEWTDLIVGVDAISRFEFGDDGWLYGVTTHDAPRGRLVRIALDAVPAGPDGWETIVAERSAVLGGLTVAGDVAARRHRARTASTPSSGDRSTATCSASSTISASCRSAA